MTMHNTQTRYGSVTKTFHWLTALLIIALIPLGVVAENLAHRIESGALVADQALVTRTAFLFSLHKTLGVAVFFVALLRIAWALTQEKPGLLNGDKPLEAFAANTVHWLLYASLVLAPLTGWIHHAATTGFAPIWWPFGQTLPFVPKDEIWAETAGTLHWLTTKVLIASLVLHIIGAIKHHAIDKDATLVRMLPGDGQGIATTEQPSHSLPFVGALVIWIAVIGGAAAAGWLPLKAHQTEAVTTLSAEGGNWQVEEGHIEITVLQMGAELSGRFSDWSASIQYADTPDANGKHGEVEVQINTASLSLGSVTPQATGAGYLESNAHPIAIFQGDLINDENSLYAVGNLIIRDIAVPLELPFSLSIEGDTAQSSGGGQVDRRDFSIGLDVTDESSLGFAVEIRFDLIATRR